MVPPQPANPHGYGWADSQPRPCLHTLDKRWITLTHTQTHTYYAVPIQKLTLIMLYAHTNRPTRTKMVHKVFVCARNEDELYIIIL